MDPDLISTWLRAERLAFADFFDELTDDEWQRESLCPGWTIHDVLAHITSVDTLGSTLAGLVRARGNWDRMNADAARRVSARYSPAELIARLRASAGSWGGGRRAPPPPPPGGRRRAHHGRGPPAGRPPAPCTGPGPSTVSPTPAPSNGF
ncbi:maleylpyruvate isomerase family mycothiol-dependent enzyme [Nocardia cyriacigeorgica]|uniref:maleylpyruvate isomerase family mycothiol-dependent enzyme n=1 Tax=Nocardia cyriacigeorgica TaxID=135487 RepID=UPI0024540F8E|nr:maleylpyruvate isomerase family mycothiol-dependent enzyme [Nocardia cyriacigeorgica]